MVGTLMPFGGPFSWANTEFVPAAGIRGGGPFSNEPRSHRVGKWYARAQAEGLQAIIRRLQICLSAQSRVCAYPNARFAVEEYRI